MHRILLPLVWTTALTAPVVADESAAAREITVDSVVLTIARQAEVPAREEGVLGELLVREGQPIKAGDLVARLDDDSARLAYQRAVLELERAQKLAANDTKVRLARKELEIAQAEMLRATQAADRFQKSVTAAEMDQLKLEVERATLACEQAEFERDSARLLVRLQENEVQSAMEKARRRRINSPLAGTVVDVSRRLGEWLESGQIVARVIATDVLRAEGFVAAEQLGHRSLNGRKVRLRVNLASLGEEPFAGTVVFVSPEVDPVSGQIRLWAEIENRDGRLRPGLSGTLTILP